MENVRYKPLKNVERKQFKEICAGKGEEVMGNLRKERFENVKRKKSREICSGRRTKEFGKTWETCKRKDYAVRIPC